MEMDLNQTRYLDYRPEPLLLACGQRGGHLSASIFGATRPETLQCGKAGPAFQLTNIIRDVGEDARKGRIYLPINELQQFNDGRRPLNARHSENFENLMASRPPARAAGVRRRLRPAAGRRPPRPAPGLIMAAIYRTLLDEVERDGYHVLQQRISLTPIRKLWLAWKTWVRG
jgi:phytoene synthase